MRARALAAAAEYVIGMLSGVLICDLLFDRATLASVFVEAVCIGMLLRALLREDD